MKKLSILAGVVALIAAAILSTTNVSALTPTYTGDDHLTLTREITGLSNNVTNSYRYGIREVSKPSGATVVGMNLYPGSSTISFTNDTPDPSNNSVRKSTTVPLDGVSFSMVGDYVYDIAEFYSDDVHNYEIDETVYTIHILVRYETDSNGVPNNNAYTATIVVEDESGNKLGPDDLLWTNGVEREYFDIHATTTGDMAEADKCFEYTVYIPVGRGANAGDTYTISSDTDCDGGATSMTPGTPATIYLMHDDGARIGQNDGRNQLPNSVDFTITKTDTSDGYTTVIEDVGQTSYTGSTHSSDKQVDIVNEKSADPFTGVFTNIWLYLLLLIVAIVGYIYFNRRSTEKQ